MSEKKSTGISKILRELKKNESPLPEYETDRTHMITTIKIHEGFAFENENFAQKKERSFDTKKYNKISAIVSFMEEHREITPKKAENITGKSAATVRRYFKSLTDTSYIEEGVRNMCRAMEEMRNETYEEAYEKAIMVLIKSGELSLEKIASLYEVSLDRVQELALSAQKA